MIIISRSYKRTPYCGDSKSKFAKRQANRRVRRRLKNIEDRLNNKTYRKVYNSWNICDYYWIIPTFEQYYQEEIRTWYIRQTYGYHDSYPSRKEAKKEYYKYYKRK